MRTSLLSILMLVVGVAIGRTLEPPEPPLGPIDDRDISAVTGIGGVFFKADDPDALRAWYRDHLGLRVEARGVNFFWRDTGDPNRFGRTVWSVFPETTAYFGPSGQNWMVNYRVADLDALLNRLREQGVEPVAGVEEYWYGRFAWVLDGEGNRVELWEPKDHSPSEFARRLKDGTVRP